RAADPDRADPRRRSGFGARLPRLRAGRRRGPGSAAAGDLETLPHRLEPAPGRDAAALLLRQHELPEPQRPPESARPQAAVLGRARPAQQLGPALHVGVHPRHSAPGQRPNESQRAAARFPARLRLLTATGRSDVTTRGWIAGVLLGGAGLFGSPALAADEP